MNRIQWGQGAIRHASQGPRGGVVVHHTVQEEEAVPEKGDDHGRSGRRAWVFDDRGPLFTVIFSDFENYISK